MQSFRALKLVIHKIHTEISKNEFIKYDDDLKTPQCTNQSGLCVSSPYAFSCLHGTPIIGAN